MQYAQPKYQGDPTIASLANGLGTLGRYGDSYMVHAAEGETVIPAEVLAANPELKNQLFWQMRMMGIQDPNRYVVGNNLNSINPITGQPEFFFKKIFRAVKKVFKKALPVIAPIVGNLIYPGLGGIIASGLVTKLQGGSWGDVLKSAAISYGMGALGEGLSGGIAGLQEGGKGFGSGFTEGLGRGVMAPFQAAGNIFAGTPLSSAPATLNPLAQGIFGPTGLNLAFPTGAAALKQLPPQTAFGSETLGTLFPTYRTGAQLEGYGINPATGQYSAPQPVPYTESSQFNPLRPGETENIRLISGTPQELVRMPDGQPAMIDVDHANSLRSVGALKQGRLTAKGADFLTQYQAKLQAGPAPSAVGGGGAPPTGSLGEVRKFGEDYYKFGPSGWVETAAPKPPFFSAEGIQQFAGTAAKTLALPVALGAAVYFMTPDPDDLSPEERAQLSDPQQSAYDEYTARGRLKDATGLSLLVEAGISPTQDAATLSANWGISQENAQDFLNSFYGATAATTATGGIAGLQGGGEIMGPGSGTSDSIPARLSDGEFVMTADAVRGIGNGNRNLGAARMYDLMSRYENGVA